MRTLTVQPLFYLFCVFVFLPIVYLFTTQYYFLAIVPGLGLLLLYLLGKRTEFGYFLILFMIPFQEYTALVEALEFLTVSKVVGILVVAIVFYQLLVRRLSFNTLRSRFWPVLFLFFILSFISALLSDYQVTSFDNIRQMITAFVVLALTLIFVSSAERYLKTLPKVLITSISICAFLSVLGYMFDISLFAMNVDSDSVKRGVGASHDPNYFAVMLVFSLPLLANWFFSSTRMFEKVCIFMLFVLNAMAVVLTYSRSGGIILGVILPLILIEHFRRFKPIYLGFVLSAIAIGFLAVIITVPSSYWERQKTVTNTKTDTSIGRRVSYLYAGWDAIKEDPILGSGPGTFRDRYAESSYGREFEKPGKTTRRAAHNAYMEVLVGTGTLGFITFLAIILVGLNNFREASKRFGKQGNHEMAAQVRAYGLSYITMTLAFMVLSMQYHKYFWMITGVSQISLWLAQNPEILEIKTKS